MRGSAGLLLALALLCAGGEAAAVSPEPPAIVAELVADQAALPPGGTMHLGVLLKVPAPWHIYWRNPGDSGLPTTIQIEAASLSAGGIHFPIPEQFTQPGDLVGYGYSGDTLFVVPVAAPADWTKGSEGVTVNVRWLACSNICVPGRATLTGSVSAGTGGPSPHGHLFAEWESRFPRETPPPFAAQVGVRPAGDSTTSIRIEADVPAGARLLSWFPLPPKGVEIRAVTVEAREVSFNARTLPGTPPLTEAYGLLTWQEGDKKHGAYLRLPL